MNYKLQFYNRIGRGKEREGKGKGLGLIISSRSLFLGDLGSKVVLELASAIVQLVLHHERGLVGHVEGDLVGQTGSLGEEVEISRSEAEPNWLIDLQSDRVLVSSIPLVQHCVASTDLASDGELDALLVGLNLDGLGKTAKFTANSVEFIGGHGTN